ncbi:MAG: S8 family serine peptidase [Flavobacteriaceae bacterium]
MNKMVLFILCFFTCITFAQEHAWVYLNSKEDIANYMANPLTMLTQKALDRRANQGISLDYTDVPVTPSYISDISNATGIAYIGASKWLNAIHVIGSQADIEALSTTFSYVSGIEFANDALNITGGVSVEENTLRVRKDKFESRNQAFTTYDYGQAQNQMQMFNAHKLHEQNFTGAGMTIAVIDAGFPNVDTNPGFDKIRTNGQILGGYDFVNDSSNFYTGHSHGSNVLSFMAGYYDGATKYVGSAPDANYYLYISEDATPETPAEETYWVMAAEQADYVGVDLINTSLGYSEFDEPKYNYDYTTDLDGATAFITRGAEIAFTKGMVLVNSAGNSGNDTSWDRRILVPSDGPNVLTVGAVNASENYASFSSRGPTSDNRIKPDVSVQGQGAYYITTSGNVSSGNGTSYSSPLLAGGVACLWQALPNATNAEIIQYVKESASIYTTPNYTLGYGIPNLELAQTLNVNTNVLQDGVSVYPNPTTKYIHVKLPNHIAQVNVVILDVLGKKVFQKKISSAQNRIDVSNLSNGVYFAKIMLKHEAKTFKIIKE